MGSRLLSASPRSAAVAGFALCRRWCPRPQGGSVRLAVGWCPPVGARVLGIGCVLEVAGFRVIVAFISLCVAAGALYGRCLIWSPFVASCRRKIPFPVAGLRSLVAYICLCVA